MELGGATGISHHTEWLNTELARLEALLPGHLKIHRLQELPVEQWCAQFADGVMLGALYMALSSTTREEAAHAKAKIKWSPRAQHVKMLREDRVRDALKHFVYLMQEPPVALVGVLPRVSRTRCRSVHRGSVTS